MPTYMSYLSYLSRMCPTANSQLSSQGQTPASTSNLPQLPPEIVLIITRSLSLQAVTSLGLSCKAFAGLLPQAFLDLKNDCHASRFAHWSVLKYLERDLAQTHYLCHSCRKLHRYYSHWSIADQEALSHNKARHDCDSKHMLYGYLRIPSRFVQLAMLRHKRGLSYGLPISALNASTTCWLRGGPVEWRIGWVARIIEGQVYLHGKHELVTLEGNKGDPCELRLGVDLIRHHVCRHVHTHKVSRSEQRDKIERLDTFHGDGPLKPPCADKFYRGWCEYCLTDWLIIFKEIPGSGQKENTYSVLLKSYHRLGDGKSPHDWEWRALINNPNIYQGHDIQMRKDLPRTRQYLGGEVMYKWNSSKDQAAFFSPSWEREDKIQLSRSRVEAWFDEFDRGRDRDQKASQR